MIVVISILLTTMAFSAEKVQCSKLKLGKEYWNCLKNKVSRNKTDDSNQDNDNRTWYQRIKEGKPLFSK